MKKERSRPSNNGSTLDALRRLMNENSSMRLIVWPPHRNPRGSVSHIYRRHGYIKIGNTAGGGFALKQHGKGPLDERPVVFWAHPVLYVQHATRSLADFLSLVAYDPEVRDFHRTREEWARGRKKFLESPWRPARHAAAAELLALPGVRALDDPTEVVDKGGFFTVPDSVAACLDLCITRIVARHTLDPAVYLDAVEATDDSCTVRLGIDLPEPDPNAVHRRAFRDLVAEIRTTIKSEYLGSAPTHLQVVFKPRA